MHYVCSDLQNFILRGEEHFVSSFKVGAGQPFIDLSVLVSASEQGVGGPGGGASGALWPCLVLLGEFLSSPLYEAQ